MYALKATLAIDGKAMYFGGKTLPSGLGLRPWDVGLRTGIPGRSLQSSSSRNLDSAGLPIEDFGLQPQWRRRA
jgi:hypothetical protein